MTSHTPFTNPWNLPEKTILKLGLMDGKITVGSSFVNEVRIFTIHEISGVYIMECDSAGQPKRNETVDILFRRENERKRGIITMNYDFLNDTTRDDFLKFINYEIKRNNF